MPGRDIFSFGAVLFEMLTGEPAFQRDSSSATIAAILRDHPASDIPREACIRQSWNS